MIVDARELHPALLEAPPSKSDAHRAFALAWMLKLPRPELARWPADVRRIADGLDRLGTGEAIDCGDGAAPFRMLLALAATLPGRRSVFTGTPRLAERPHAPLFRALGLTQTAWPLTIDGREPPTSFTVECALSSQYASALVLAACRAQRPIDVHLTGPTASRGYLELTLRWVRAAGFELDETAERIRILRHRPVTQLPPVPPDWSSLGYLLLIAHASGGEVDARGSSDHPDRALLDHLHVRNKGGQAPFSSSLEINGACPPLLRGGHDRLQVDALPDCVDTSVARSPDLAPTLAAIALAGKKTSTLRDVAILRHKESDRLAALIDLAKSVGARATLQHDTLELTPATAPPHFDFDCRDDHRLTLAAVSLATLFRCRAGLTRTDGVDKSFPGFFTEAAKAGLVFAG